MKRVSNTRSKPSRAAPRSSRPCHVGAPPAGRTPRPGSPRPPARAGDHDASGSDARAASQHLLERALLAQRAGRADHDALPAVDAARDVEALVERRADPRPAAAADEVDGRRRPGPPRTRARTCRRGCTWPGRGRSTGWTTSHAWVLLRRRSSAAGARPARSASACSSQSPLRTQ